MKNFERPGKWKRYILPVLVLAAVCIGAVELLVCSWQAPDLYNAITAPVRGVAQRMGELGEAAWDRLGLRFDSAVAEGISQVRAGLRRLDDYLTRLKNLCISSQGQENAPHWRCPARSCPVPIQHL